MKKISFDPFSVSTSDGGRLQGTRIYLDNSMNKPVVLVHGVIENNRIFFTLSGRRLAPFLARRGYDVYAINLRGRGRSTPSIHSGVYISQNDSITKDLPALCRYIRENYPNKGQTWIAHSWGGVLVTAFLARFPEYLKNVDHLAFFGTKRRVQVKNLQRLLYIDLFWNRAAGFLTKVYGYLPALSLGFGGENEPAQFHADTVRWVKEQQWIDPTDGFDYGKASKMVQWPPLLSITATSDRCLGHVQDAKAFIKEAGLPPDPFYILSKKNQHLHDYDHVSMLTHVDAERDHFPLLADWIA